MTKRMLIILTSKTILSKKLAWVVKKIRKLNVGSSSNAKESRYLLFTNIVRSIFTFLSQDYFCSPSYIDIELRTRQQGARGTIPGFR